MLLIICSVMSNCLRPHGLQRNRLSCPSLSPWICSNSTPLTDDAIHPSDPLLSSSPPALNLSQHQRLHIYFAQLLSCVWLCDLMDCSPPGSSVYGIFQARILEQVAIFYSRGSFWPRNQTCVSYTSPHWQADSLLLHHLGNSYICVPRNRTWVSCIAGRFFTNWAMRETHTYGFVCVCVCIYINILCMYNICIHTCVYTHMYFFYCL